MASPTNDSLTSMMETVAMEQAVLDVDNIAPQSDVSTTKKRGKYHKLSDELRAQIGEYAYKYGNNAAVLKFSSQFEKPLNESTVREIKRKYIEAMEQRGDTVDVLPKEKRGRPLLLGDEMDKEVQKYIEEQRKRSVPITRDVVIAAGRGIVMKHDEALLAENGGEINLTKHWAASILGRMNYVKRRGTTKPRCLPEKFDEIKEQFLQDILTTVVMEEIPNELIINWDQTAISLVPGSSWTMERSGTRRVEIAGLGDKRQITAVLGGTLTGYFLPPQLICTIKIPACHPKNVAFPSDWHITNSPNHRSNEETVNDYVLNSLITRVKLVIAAAIP